VQLAQHWRDVFPPPSSSKKSSGGILDRLNLPDVAVRHAVKQLLWNNSSDRGKRCIKIKPARRETPWRLVSFYCRPHCASLARA